ncbi:MAG: aspartate kinase [Sporolactobacillus sp.]
MTVSVMKFGGTSVATTARIERAAVRISREHARGRCVVVVVSAMGKATDRLLELANQVAASPDKRELDALLATGEQRSAALLAMALIGRGCPAVSLTGWQAGIKTEPVHGGARIMTVDAATVRAHLRNGQIVVVTGFQGVDSSNAVTTLGRGGSDTSAVALAVALGAARCEIYTDVTGVFTTDPRVLSQARKLKEISYDEMLEMAYLGAGVLHPRAVEYAKNNHIELVVRSSFSDEDGTVIKEEVAMETAKIVRGLAFERKVSKVTLIGLTNQMTAVSRVFDAIAEKRINVDVIVQDVLNEEKTSLSFTLDSEGLAETLDLLKGAQDALGFDQVLHESNLAKVSIIGSGMASNPGVAAHMFHALAEKGIKVKMISTSEIKVSTIIDEDRLQEALETLHHTFALDEEESYLL